MADEIRIDFATNAGSFMQTLASQLQQMEQLVAESAGGLNSVDFGEQILRNFQATMAKVTEEARATQARINAEANRAVQTATATTPYVKPAGGHLAAQDATAGVAILKQFNEVTSAFTSQFPQLRASLQAEARRAAQEELQVRRQIADANLAALKQVAEEARRAGARVPTQAYAAHGEDAKLSRAADLLFPEVTQAEINEQKQARAKAHAADNRAAKAAEKAAAAAESSAQASATSLAEAKAADASVSRARARKVRAEEKAAEAAEKSAAAQVAAANADAQAASAPRRRAKAAPAATDSFGTPFETPVEPVPVAKRAKAPALPKAAPVESSFNGDYDAYDAAVVKFEDSIRTAIARGRLTLEEAARRGFQGTEQLTKLPDDLFHVTTARSATLSQGLQSRTAQGVGEPHEGFGQASPNMVALTTSRNIAESVVADLKQFQALLSGKTALSSLVNEAKAGDFQHIYSDQAGASQADLRKPYKADAALSDAENEARRLQEVAYRYDAFLEARQGSGVARPNPGIVEGADLARLAAMDPAEIAALRVTPADRRFKGQPYAEGSGPNQLQEIRIPDASMVKLVSQLQRLRPSEELTQQARADSSRTSSYAQEQLAREARANSEYLQQEQVAERAMAKAATERAEVLKAASAKVAEQDFGGHGSAAQQEFAERERVMAAQQAKDFLTRQATEGVTERPRTVSVPFGLDGRKEMSAGDAAAHQRMVEELHAETKRLRGIGASNPGYGYGESATPQVPISQAQYSVLKTMVHPDKVNDLQRQAIAEYEARNAQPLHPVMTAIHKATPHPGSDMDFEGEEEDYRRQLGAFENSVRTALSRGKISLQEAQRGGYWPEFPDKFGPLPNDLYHVTTAKTAVEAEGFKTRTQLGQGDSGHGLGGGPRDVVSFTGSKQLADSILRDLQLFHQVLNGIVTNADLRKLAKGEGFKLDLPNRTKAADAELDEDSLRRTRAQAFQEYLGQRDIAGVQDNPVFFGTDTKALAARPYDELGVIHARPEPGVLGSHDDALDEYRVAPGLVHPVVAQQAAETKAAAAAEGAEAAVELTAAEKRSAAALKGAATRRANAEAKKAAAAEAEAEAVAQEVTQTTALRSQLLGVLRAQLVAQEAKVRLESETASTQVPLPPHVQRYPVDPASEVPVVTQFAAAEAARAARGRTGQFDVVPEGVATAEAAAQAARAARGRAGQFEAVPGLNDEVEQTELTAEQKRSAAARKGAETRRANAAAKKAAAAEAEAAAEATVAQQVASLHSRLLSGLRAQVEAQEATARVQRTPAVADTVVNTEAGAAAVVEQTAAERRSAAALKGVQTRRLNAEAKKAAAAEAEATPIQVPHPPHVQRYPVDAASEASVLTQFAAADAARAARGRTGEFEVVPEGAATALAAAEAAKAARGRTGEFEAVRDTSEPDARLTAEEVAASKQETAATRQNTEALKENTAARKTSSGRGGRGGGKPPKPPTGSTPPADEPEPIEPQSEGEPLPPTQPTKRKRRTREQINADNEKYFAEQKAKADAKAASRAHDDEYENEDGDPEGGAGEEKGPTRKKGYKEPKTAFDQIQYDYAKKLSGEDAAFSPPKILADEKGIAAAAQREMDQALERVRMTHLQEGVRTGEAEYFGDNIVTKSGSFFRPTQGGEGAVGLQPNQLNRRESQHAEKLAADAAKGAKQDALQYEQAIKEISAIHAAAEKRANLSAQDTERETRQRLERMIGTGEASYLGGGTSRIVDKNTGELYRSTQAGQGAAPLEGAQLTRAEREHAEALAADRKALLERARLVNLENRVASGAASPVGTKGFRDTDPFGNPTYYTKTPAGGAAQANATESLTLDRQYREAERKRTEDLEKAHRQASTIDDERLNAAKLAVAKDNGQLMRAGSYSQLIGPGGKPGDVYAATSNGARRLNGADPESQYELIRAREAIARQKEADAQKDLRNGQGGFLKSFASTVTSRSAYGSGSGAGSGFNIANVPSNLGARLGSMVESFAGFAVLGAVTATIADTKKETLDYIDSLTNLEVRMGKTGSVTAVFTNQLEGLSRIAGSNVGAELDAAARSISAFGDASTMDAKALREVGEAGAAAASQLAVISGQDLPTASNNLVAIASSFDVAAGGLTAVGNAVANAKRLGGESAEITNGLAGIADVAKAAGYNMQQAADIVSLVTARTNESGQSAATRITAIFALLGTHQAQLAAVGVDVSKPVRDQIQQLAKIWQSPELTAAKKKALESQLGGRSGLRELLPIINENDRLTEMDNSASASAGVDEQARKNRDLAGLFRKLSGDWTNIQINLVRSGLFDGLGAMLKALEPVLHTVSDILGLFDRLTAMLGPMKGLTGSVLDLVIALRVLNAVGILPKGLRGIPGVGGDRTRGTAADTVTNTPATQNAPLVFARATRSARTDVGQAVKDNTQAYGSGATRPGFVGPVTSNEAILLSAGGKRIGQDATTAADLKVVKAAESLALAEQQAANEIRTRTVAWVNTLSRLSTAASKAAIALDRVNPANSAVGKKVPLTAAEKLEQEVAGTAARDAAKAELKASGSALRQSLGAINGSSVRNAVPALAGAVRGGINNLGNALGGSFGTALIGGTFIDATYNKQNDINKADRAIMKLELTGSSSDDLAAASTAFGSAAETLKLAQGGVGGHLLNWAKKGISEVPWFAHIDPYKANGDVADQKWAQQVSDMLDMQDKKLQDVQSAAIGIDSANALNYQTPNGITSGLDVLKKQGMDSTQMLDALIRSLESFGSVASHTTGTLLKGQSDLIAQQQANNAQQLLEQNLHLNIELGGDSAAAKLSQQGSANFLKMDPATVNEALTEAGRQYYKQHALGSADGNKTLTEKQLKEEANQQLQAVKAQYLNDNPNDMAGWDAIKKETYLAILSADRRQQAAVTASNGGKIAKDQIGQVLDAEGGLLQGAGQEAQVRAELNGDPRGGAIANLDTQRAKAKKIYDSLKKSGASDEELQQAKDMMDALRVQEQSAIISHIDALAALAESVIAPFDKGAQIDAEIAKVKAQIVAAGKNKDLSDPLRAKLNALDYSKQQSAEEDAKAAAGVGLGPDDTVANAQKAHDDAVRDLQLLNKQAAEEKRKGVKQVSHAQLDAAKKNVADTGAALIDAKTSHTAALAAAAIDPRDTLGQDANALAAALAAQANDSDRTGADGKLTSRAAGEDAAVLAARQKQAEDTRARDNARALSKINPQDTIALAARGVKADEDAVRADFIGSEKYYNDEAKLATDRQNLAALRVARANASRDSKVRQGDPLSAASAALADAKANLGLDQKGTEKYFKDLAAVDQQAYALAQAYEQQANTLMLLHIDTTDPVAQARAALAAATRKLNDDKKNKTGNLDQDALDKETAQQQLQRAQFDQQMSNQQMAYQLHQESADQYLNFLKSQDSSIRKQLSGMKKGQEGYQQLVDELNSVDSAIQGMNDSLQGQFNLGDIKLPTVYEVRRAVSQGAIGSAAAVANSVVNNAITINGTDTATVIQFLTSVLGKSSATLATTGRKGK